MTRPVVAVEFARAYFEDLPPVKIDGRDLAYLYIAAQLLQKNPPLEKRLQAIELLEQEPFPNGRRDSLSVALGGRRPARRPRKRGVDPFAYKTRGIIIVHVISELCKRFKLKPLRNRTAKDKGKADSACSVVVEALRLVDVHMTEGAVEKIWNGRHKPWPADAGFPPKGFPV